MRPAPLRALALGLALAMPLAIPLSALAAPSGRLTVTGEGSVSAAPDTATITLGVTTVAASAAGALSANSAAMASVTKILEAKKVPAQNIRTSGLSLRADYGPRTANQPPKITGYTASNTVVITLWGGVARTGTILDAVVNDGANRLDGLSFGFANPSALETQARKDAVADALARARTLAVAAGVKLGPIISITEAGSPVQPVASARLAAAAMPVPISPGTLDVTDRVTIVWSLEQ